MKPFYTIWSIVTLSIVSSAGKVPRQTCTIQPGGSPSIDDAPAVIDAFKQCGQDGKVEFLNETYHINTVMNTTGLKNCEVDLKGTLLACETYLFQA